MTIIAMPSTTLIVHFNLSVHYQGLRHLVKMCAVAWYTTKVSCPSQYIKMLSYNKAGLGPFTCLDGTKFVLLTVFTRRFALRFG